MERYPDITGFFQGLQPVRRISVSQWADGYRYLSPISSAESGKYRTDRTPYMRKIMDCLSVHEPYRKVVFMKAAQIGATESGTNFIGYIMHVAPAPVMMVQPTEEMVKRLSKGRIDPLIEMCPEVKARVAQNKSRDSKNTITQKSFKGGVLVLAGANSASGLRSVPIQDLILDEVDAYPLDLEGEGSPIELAIARTRTFPNKKIFIISTPTISGISVIEQEFTETDQQYYYVPCPHCGTFQKLMFEQLKWEENKPETALYYCAHCQRGIEERHKIEMFKHGQWIAELPERSNYETIGFHLNSLYSPFGWLSWKDIAKEFNKAKDVPSRLKVFVNTILGETWAEKGEAPPYKNLYNRREDYKINQVPDGVCFLTAGVDIQRDRIELEIVGWCKDKRSYSIDYRVLIGETAGEDVWNELAKIVDETWPRTDGTRLPLLMMAIDTGYNTSTVHEFCRRFDPKRVIPIKGTDRQTIAVSPPKSVDLNKAGKRVGKFKQWNIAVNMLKGDLYSYLRLEKDERGVPPPNYCHFPMYDEHYFRGLTAEEQVRKRDRRGFYKYEWIKKYDRNEPLDCRIYARAGAIVLGLDRLPQHKIEEMLSLRRAVIYNRSDTGTKTKRKRESDFWD